MMQKRPWALNPQATAQNLSFRLEAFQDHVSPSAQTLNPKPQTLDPKPQTPNPKPLTLNPKP